jgi:hypothetical protein
MALSIQAGTHTRRRPADSRLAKKSDDEDVEDEDDDADDDTDDGEDEEADDEVDPMTSETNDSMSPHTAGLIDSEVDWARHASRAGESLTAGI